MQSEIVDDFVMQPFVPVKGVHILGAGADSGLWRELGKMKNEHNRDAELATIELMYASAEIAYSQDVTDPIARALNHIESAISHLQPKAQRGHLEKRGPIGRIDPGGSSDFSILAIVRKRRRR